MTVAQKDKRRKEEEKTQLAKALRKSIFIQIKHRDKTGINEDARSDEDRNKKFK